MSPRALARTKSRSVSVRSYRALELLAGQPRTRARVGRAVDRCHGVSGKGCAEAVRRSISVLKGIGGTIRCPQRNTFLDESAGAPTARHGTRTALYLRVSTADQKPDLQYDGLRAYAARAGLDVVQDYCDVAVSGRREGRPSSTP